MSNHLKQNQQGETSIIVTLIIAIVITLMVIGFSQLSNKANQQALDNTLSTAAYYAAESGINAAYIAIQSVEQQGGTVVAQTRHCTVTNKLHDSTYSGFNVLNSANTVEYTCLLVNPAPPSLNYAPLDVGISQVVPVFGQSQTTDSPDKVATITISWQADGAPTLNFGGCPSPDTFYSERNWPQLTQCAAGVLQVDIAPATGWRTNPTLLQKETQTVFLYPRHGAHAPATSSIVNGDVVAANCSRSPATTQYDCNVTLQTNNLSGYYLHITPIYENADLSITATSPSNHPLNLYNAQALIDSTGEAKDELKRIQERVSINPVENNNASSYALQSQHSICKLLKVYPGSATGAPLTSC